MIELELWRARIGLYHAASACRRSKRLKNSSQSHRLSTTTKWGSKEAVDDIPFALRSCIAGVSLLLVVQCICTFLKKQHIRKALSSFVEGSYRVVKAVLTSGVPLLLKVCVVMIPLLLLLAGDVERNPGPTEGTIVAAEHVNELAAVLNKVAASWDLFVGQLGLAHHVVQQIQYDNAGKPELSKRCLLSGLQHWVESTDTPTYEKIVAALRSDTIGRKPLADDVQKFAEQCERMKDERKLGGNMTLPVQLVTSTGCKAVKVPFGCGCGACPLFGNDDCPTPSITFPIMEKEKLCDSEVDRLRAQTLFITKKFNKLVTATLQYFRQKRTSPSDITPFLIGLEAYTPIFKGKKQLLFQQVYDEMKTAENVMQMMGKIQPYFSFFDFDILEHIIENCCTDGVDVRAQLESYKIDFAGYISRRIFELPSSISKHGDSDQRDVVVKLDSTFEECSGCHLKLFQQNLSELLHVSFKGVLRLRDIKLGCFELTFQVPFFVAEAIFPLTEAQERGLPTCNVLRLSCGDYHWPHQDCQSDDNSPKPPDDDDEGSLAVQLEQVEVVSKGDPPPDEPGDDGDSALGTSLGTSQHTSDKSKTITSKSSTITRALDIDDTLKELKKFKERDEANAKRQDKPLLHIQAFFGHIDAMKSAIEQDKSINPDCVDDYGNRPLHQATLAGHISIVKYLIKELSCQPASPGNEGRTPLHLAALHGHLDIVKYLVDEEGLDPLVEDSSQSTPLHYGAFIGHMAITEYLSEEMMKYRSNKGYKTTAASEVKCSDVHYLIHKLDHYTSMEDVDGNDPLHYACLGGHVKVIELLISKFSFDPHAMNTSGKTALHIAACGGHLNIVKCLIEKYKLMPLLAEPTGGFTPLHHCALGGHLDILRYLILEKHCSPLCTSQQGMIPLHSAAAFGQIHVVKYLIQNLRCDPNFADDAGYTPFHAAAEHGHKIILEFYLVNKKCNINRRINCGDTALSIAIRRNQLNIVKYLLELKCDPISANSKSVTSLHLAAQEGFTDILKHLIFNLHCDPNLRDHNGYTPLHYAASEGLKQVVHFLITTCNCDPNTVNDEGVSILHSAARGGNVSTIKCLIKKHKCKHLVTDSFGNTPLYHAAEKGQLPVVKYFVAKGIYNPMYGNILGATPLHIAAGEGHANVVKYFTLHFQCDANSRDKNGRTPLHYAASFGHANVLKLLVSDLKCDPKYALHIAAMHGQLNVIECLIEDLNCTPVTTDRVGNTPLHFSAMGGFLEIVKYLTLKRNCDPSIVNKNRRSPLHLAIKSGHLNIVTFYIEDLVIPADIRGREYSFLMQLASELQQHNIVEYLQQKRHPHKGNNTCIQM